MVRGRGESLEKWEKRIQVRFGSQVKTELVLPQKVRPHGQRSFLGWSGHVFRLLTGNLSPAAVFYDVILQLPSQETFSSIDLAVECSARFPDWDEEKWDREIQRFLSYSALSSGKKKYSKSQWTAFLPQTEQWKAFLPESPIDPPKELEKESRPELSTNRLSVFSVRLPLVMCVCFLFSGVLWWWHDHGRTGSSAPPRMWVDIGAQGLLPPLSQRKREVNPLPSPFRIPMPGVKDYLLGEDTPVLGDTIRRSDWAE